MVDFYQPDLGSDPDNPFARDDKGKLVRLSFWLDMSDRNLTLAMTQGVGNPLSADQKRSHLNDIGREHLISDICVQEIIPPDSEA
ncbi:MAG: hypothetical protein CL567_04335 [Alphaproteobacteria bacterium]|nr:hypothetical protein [Alphaproteobacteria bacterium]|tara:strand:+ start:2588 stop:2842 length:255 start_codon:yes stop_codon:yes gene_type:complete